MATASSAHFELQNPLQKPTGDVTDYINFFLQFMVLIRLFFSGLWHAQDLNKKETMMFEAHGISFP